MLFLNSIIKKIFFIKIFYVTNNLFSTMKGVVYKLYCKDLAIKEIYVGSSMNINQRIDCHKNVCNNSHSIDYNMKVYKFIRANGGWFNWAYDILEECEVKDKEDLVLNYERKYQLELVRKLYTSEK